MSKEYKTNIAKETVKFTTGAQREKKAGKGRYDLLPGVAIARVAKVYERGCFYGARNWEAGLPMSSFMDSTLRHMFQYLQGMRDEDHLAQAAWNILGAIHTEDQIEKGNLPQELADLPAHIKKEVVQPVKPVDETTGIGFDWVEAHRLAQKQKDFKLQEQKDFKFKAGDIVELIDTDDLMGMVLGSQGKVIEPITEGQIGIEWLHDKGHTDYLHSDRFRKVLPLDKTDGELLPAGTKVITALGTKGEIVEPPNEKGVCLAHFPAMGAIHIPIHFSELKPLKKVAGK